MFAKITFHVKPGRCIPLFRPPPSCTCTTAILSSFPAPDKKFRRLEVVSGGLLPDNVNLQEVQSGLEPGQQVVTNALVLDHVLAQ